MSEIRHIVFDIGKVLIHYDPEIPFRRLIPDPKQREWFFATVCTHEWNLEQDRGRSWAEAEQQLIALHPDHEELIRAFRQHWPEMVSHAYDDSVEILKSVIDQGHDVTMLTNFASDTFSEARQKFPFLNLARGITVSAEVGLIKPQREIYDLHASTFGLDPEATIFIDDSRANVDGAQAAGWRAVQFVSADQLRKDFQAYGIKT